jgi:hypothetical protein
MQHGNSSRHQEATVSSGAAAEIFLLLMLVLLPVADQTALPIRKPRRNRAWRTGRTLQLQHFSLEGHSQVGCLSPALETASQSAGLRNKIYFRASRADWIMDNQFINLLVVLLPVGSA